LALPIDAVIFFGDNDAIITTSSAIAFGSDNWKSSDFLKVSVSIAVVVPIAHYGYAINLRGDQAI